MSKACFDDRIRTRSTWLRRWLCLLALAFSSVTAIQASARPAAWSIKAGDVTLMTFTLARHQGRWTGVWRQPSSYNLDGEHLAGAKGAAVSRIAKSVSSSKGHVTMVFASVFPHGADDEFVISVSSDGRATLRWNAYAGLAFVLADASTPSLRDAWNPSKSYSIEVIRPINSEMSAMFDADQQARRNPAAIDWDALRKGDARRRARTRELLDENKLSSAADYYHAAYVFQHGYTPDDYLEGHVLALIAVARGYDASWIAAATLDRYLQAIGRPQIYGTQFRQKDGAFTQEPFDRKLVRDAEREASHVPDLVGQEKQRRDLNSPASE